MTILPLCPSVKMQTWQWCLLTTLIVLLHAQKAAQLTETVDCVDQQESCECKREANICEFTLEIRQLQTFTSYYKDSEGKLVTPEKRANNYYLNESGFIPSLPPPFDSTIPEYGPCWREHFNNASAFAEASCSIPMTVDGITYRSFIAVNARIPGPTLIVTEGQTVVVNVVNKLTSEGVTIHWHGISQQDAPWMDGVAFVSQLPITPGATFRYIFKASPLGTHWYHSHSGAQRSDGLFGALIIREKMETFTRASESIGLGSFVDEPSKYTLTLLDWQQDPSPELYAKVNSVGFFMNKSVGAVPKQTDRLFYRTRSTDGTEIGAVPYWSGLINGRGRYDSDTHSLLSVFNVEFGQVYRFRVIGAQSLYAYKIEVEGHKLVVIATDGYFIQPLKVDYIIIHSGERYDFLLNATQPARNYWIRASTLEQNSEGSDVSRHTAEAVLHYEDEAVGEPNPFSKYDNVMRGTRRCTVDQPCVAVNCPFKEYSTEMNTRCVQIHELNSLFENPLDELPSVEATQNCKDCLQFFNFAIDHTTRFQPVNSRTLKLPLIPYQTYSGQYNIDLNDPNINTCENCRAENDETVDCKCTYVVKIMSGYTRERGRSETVLMVLSALEPFTHPVHIHGHRFFIIYVGHGTYEDGILTQYSQDLECEFPHCLNPRWRNGVPPNLSKYSTNGKLRNRAIQKDTVIVPAGGYVVVALLPDNPGYWLLHCHIEVHLLAGMGVILQEYPESEHNTPPERINRGGNFLWTVEDFNEKIERKKSAESEDRNNIECDSVEGWKVAFWVCVVLVVLVLVVVCFGGGCWFWSKSQVGKGGQFWKRRTSEDDGVKKVLTEYNETESEFESSKL